MSQPPAPADPECLGTTEPFSAEALRLNQAKLITSDVERQELSSEIEQLRSEGFVILSRQICGDTLEGMRDALDEINRDTRLGIHEFEGYRTHRAYCAVAKTLVFDELVMNRSVLAIVEGYFGESPQLSASMRTRNPAGSPRKNRANSLDASSSIIPGTYGKGRKARRV